MSRTVDPTTALYRASQVRELDRLAIEEQGIPGLTLMERAGAAAFQSLGERWPEARKIAILCGAGNNGGDGFVVARLAHLAGIEVTLFQLGNPERRAGDARTSAEKWRAAGGRSSPPGAIPADTDLIIDGLLGTGLTRAVTGEWASAIDAINRHPAPVMALDIPSGLNADSGMTMGCAVRADHTATFIGLKQGLFTGEGPDHCGEIVLFDLEVPSAVYRQSTPDVTLDNWSTQPEFLLPPRPRTAHKGCFGHLLVIGGEVGMGGAARLAAEGGLRTGAGLITVATRPQHAATLGSGRPELMCVGVEGSRDLDPLLDRASVVVIGPGLGQSEWSRALLDRVLDTAHPKVVDADALNLLATRSVRSDNWTLTPHPGEAARLLGCSRDAVQADRIEAVRALQRRYGGVALLKGAGTLIQGAERTPTALCSDGNPGMAVGGMGDLLSGIIGALLAQGVEQRLATRLGVSLHGAAGDAVAARQGERGMAASDLLERLPLLLNRHALPAGDPSPEGE